MNISHADGWGSWFEFKKKPNVSLSSAHKNKPIMQELTPKTTDSFFARMNKNVSSFGKITIASVASLIGLLTYSLWNYLSEENSVPPINLLREEIARLRRDNDRLTRENEQSNQANNNLRETEIRLTNDNTRLNNVNNELLARINGLTNNNTELQQTNNELTNDNNDLEQENNRLNRANNTLEQTNNELQNDNNGLEQNNERLTQINNELQHANNTLRNNINNLEHAADNLVQEKNSLQEICNKLQNELNKVTLAHDELNENNSNAQMQIQKLNKQIEELKDNILTLLNNRIEQKNEFEQELKVQGERARKEKLEFQIQLEDKKKEIVKLQEDNEEKLKNSGTIVQELRKEVEQLNVSLELEKRKKSDSERLLQVANNKNNDLWGETICLTKNLEDQKNEFTHKLQLQDEKANTEKKDLEKQLDDKENTILDLQNKNYSLIKDHDDLKRNNNELQQKINSVNERIDRADQDLEKNQMELQKVQLQLNLQEEEAKREKLDLQKNLDDKVKSINDLKQKNENLTNDLNVLNLNNDQLQQEVISGNEKVYKVESDLKKEVSNKDLLIEELQKKISQQDEFLKEALKREKITQGRLQDVEQESEKQKKQFEETLENLEKNSEEQKNNIVTLQDQVDKVSKEKLVTEKKLEEKETIINEQQKLQLQSDQQSKKLDETIKLLETNEKELIETKDDIVKLKSDLLGFYQKIPLLKNEIKALTEKNKELDDNSEADKKKSMKLQEELEKEKKNARDRDEHCTFLNESLQNIKKETSSLTILLKKNWVDLQNQIDELKKTADKDKQDQIEDLEKRLTIEKKSAENIENRINLIQQTLDPEVNVEQNKHENVDLNEKLETCYQILNEEQFENFTEEKQEMLTSVLEIIEKVETALEEDFVSEDNNDTENNTNENNKEDSGLVENEKTLINEDRVKTVLKETGSKISFDELSQKAHLGGNYLFELYYGDPKNIPSGNQKEYLDSIAALSWYLYSEAVNKGQAFNEGTFVIQDKDLKLYNFLMGYAKLVNTNIKGETQDIGTYTSNVPFCYPRRSSHFEYCQKGSKGGQSLNKERFTQYGIDMHYDIDAKTVPLLPHNNKHLLFGLLDKEKNIIFIKPEGHGVYTLKDRVHHTLGFAQTVLRKVGLATLMKYKLTEKSQDFLKSKITEVKDLLDSKKIQQLGWYDNSEVKFRGLQYLSTHKLVPEIVYELDQREVKDCSLYDHMHMRHLEEVILTPAEFLSSLYYHSMQNGEEDNAALIQKIVQNLKAVNSVWKSIQRSLRTKDYSEEDINRIGELMKDYNNLIEEYKKTEIYKKGDYIEWCGERIIQFYKWITGDYLNLVNGINDSENEKMAKHLDRLLLPYPLLGDLTEYSYYVENTKKLILQSRHLGIQNAVSTMKKIMQDNVIITNNNGQARINDMNDLLSHFDTLCDDQTLKSLDKKELEKATRIVKEFFSYVCLCMDYRKDPVIKDYDYFFGKDVKNKINPKDFYKTLYSLASMNVDNPDALGIEMKPEVLHELTENLRKKYTQIKNEKKENLSNIDSNDTLVRAIDIIRDPKIKFLYDAFIQSKDDEELKEKVMLSGTYIKELTSVTGKSLDLQDKLMKYL